MGFQEGLLETATIVGILIIICMLQGCVGGYGTRHTVEDYDLVRFEQTTIYVDGQISRDTDLAGCDTLIAYASAEHDIAGDPFKIVQAGAGCQFSIGE